MKKLIFWFSDYHRQLVGNNFDLNGRLKNFFAVSDYRNGFFGYYGYFFKWKDTVGYIFAFFCKPKNIMGSSMYRLYERF